MPKESVRPSSRFNYFHLSVFFPVTLIFPDSHSHCAPSLAQHNGHMQTLADREGIFHLTAPLLRGTRLRLHKPLLNGWALASGGKEFGVRDELMVCRPRLTLDLPSCLAKVEWLEMKGRSLRPPSSLQSDRAQSEAGRPTSLSTRSWDPRPRPQPQAAAPPPPGRQDAHSPARTRAGNCA